MQLTKWLCVEKLQNIQFRYIVHDVIFFSLDLFRWRLYSEEYGPEVFFVCDEVKMQHNIRDL